MAQTFTDANVNEIIATGRPVVVDLWATWCGPCRALAPIIDQLAEKYDGQVEIGKYNCDDENDFAVEHGVRGLPTILFFKGGDKPVFRLTGSQSAETLEAKIAELLAL